MTLAGMEGDIRHLMSRDSINFGIEPLVIFLVPYVLLSAASMGLSLPQGSFVPNLLLGALNGRITGEVMKLVFNENSISTPGIYAMVGAAAQLSSWTRTMITVCMY